MMSTSCPLTSSPQQDDVEWMTTHEMTSTSCPLTSSPWPANKDWGPVVVVTGGVPTTMGKNEKNPKIYKFRIRMSAQITSLTNKTKPCMLLCAWPANKDCGPVCCSKAPPHNNPHLQTKTAAPCVVPRPPCHDNLHLQTKTVAPCVVPRPPPHNNLLVVVEWFLQTKTGAPCVVLTLHC